MESNANPSKSRYLRIFIGALVVVLSLVVLAGILVGLITLGKTPSKRSFRETNDCRERAMGIKRSMDTSVDPCKHFFNFTCGNYKTEIVGKPNWDTAGEEVQYQRYLEIVLNDTQKFIPPAENFRAFHYACVNAHTDSSKMNFKNDLKNILKRLKWPPLTKNWNSVAAGFNWLDFQEKLIKMGFFNSLFTISSRSGGDGKEYIVFDCGPSSKLSKEFNMTKEKEAIERVVSYIRLLEGEQKLAKEIAQIFVEIEKIKKRTISQRLIFRDTSTVRLFGNLRPLGLLEKILQINFVKFCHSIFPSFMNISKWTTIQWGGNCPSKLIKFLTKSSKRAVAGYMLLDGIVDLSLLIEDDKRERDRECYEYNRILLPDLWYYIYVKTYSSEERKNKVLKMLNLVLDEGQALISNSWLSASSKKVIHNKLSKLKFFVDHEEEYVTDKYIQSTFGKLKFNASDMIKSIMQLKAHSFKRSWKVFTLNTEKRAILKMHSEMVMNAYNNILLNILIIPASVFMPILYSDDFEDSLNFGGLGSILAHEIFHTIDYGSMMFDDNYNYGFWLNKKDKSLMDKKIKCFVNQYSHYQLTSEFHVNGDRTLNENLADSGILLVYRAYLKWLKTNSVKQLPVLNKFNNRQIFWITFANIWCENYDKEFLESIYHDNDVHTIGKYRVLGTLSNLEEFSKDFNCPVNSDMNPKKKCKLYH